MDIIDRERLRITISDCLLSGEGQTFINNNDYRPLSLKIANAIIAADRFRD